jgi:hypothetical protein
MGSLTDKSPIKATQAYSYLALRNAKSPRVYI